MNKAWDSQTQASRENLLNGAIDDTNTPKVAANQDAGGSKDVLIKLALDKLKESKKSSDDVKPMPNEGDGKEETAVKPKPDHRIDANEERHKEREGEVEAL
eukprot:TRINITY_DN3041_c0_g1_i4.p4 TRINITY_DN3041_c0_g1~~TRINITY_DN3041_c0_g1_i4.p4  ORF type:complete len:101 (+),score=35.82 TRINITY_DN3041_c0_g1_i4:1186-1488(+)